jgi:putative endonuclease
VTSASKRPTFVCGPTPGSYAAMGELQIHSENCTTCGAIPTPPPWRLCRQGYRWWRNWHPSAYFVYLLLCSDGTYYTGSTTDVQRRLREHQGMDGAKYTRTRLPVKLAWVAREQDRSHAQRLEAMVKKRTHADKVAMAESHVRAHGEEP